jgi:hypothetical protein
MDTRGNSVIITLTKGKVALIDTEDLLKIAGHSWYFQSGYAATSIGGRKNKKMIYMHRLIMGITDNKIRIDHINHDKLDNRKQNLRACSHSENGKNLPVRKSSNKTSKYKGVYFDKSRDKWTARIKVDYKGIFLGRFDDEKQAALAYNKAAQTYFGEFACLNEMKS